MITFEIRFAEPLYSGFPYKNIGVTSKQVCLRLTQHFLLRQTLGATSLTGSSINTADSSLTKGLSGNIAAPAIAVSSRYSRLQVNEVLKCINNKK